VDIKLGNISIREPDDFDIEVYNITKATRLSSGEMSMDFIAKKRKFLIKYVAMSGSEYDKIASIIDTSNMFFTIEYTDNGKRKSATVYCGPIKRKKFRTKFGWYWKDVTFNLIER
jgi:hypothetical protein